MILQVRITRKNHEYAGDDNFYQTYYSAGRAKRVRLNYLLSKG